MATKTAGPTPMSPLGNRPPLVDQLTARVLEHIRTNQLAPGTRLPSTAEMSKAFGVAATTLREALSRLETTGVLDIRHGVGIFVKSDASRLVLVNTDHSQRAEGRLADLVDARLLLEPTLAGRAAARHPDEDLERMWALLTRSEENRADRVRAGESNLQFHGQVARAAGNPVVADLLSAILELHAADQLIIDSIVDDPERDHAEHLAIYEAVAAGDAERSRDLMTQHLKGVLSAVKGDGP